MRPKTAATIKAALHAQLAKTIARDLFTDGQGARAQRLVLTIDGPPRLDLGGLSESVVVDRIAARLTGETRPRGRRRA